MAYVEQDTLERVHGEHVWHGPAMLARRDEWTHVLPDEAIAELDAAVLRVASERISLLDINRNTFDMPVLRDWLKPIRQQLQRGIAFALIRGLPVHRYDRLAAAAAYARFGAGIDGSQQELFTWQQTERGKQRDMAVAALHGAPAAHSATTSSRPRCGWAPGTPDTPARVASSSQERWQ